MWVASQWSWQGMMIVLALVLAAIGYLPWLSVFFFALLLGALWGYERAGLHLGRPLVWAAWFLSICLGILLALYKPRGFHYPVVFSVEQLHPQGRPFSLNINTAKILTGYLLLCWWWPRVRVAVRAPVVGLWVWVLVGMLSLSIILLAWLALGLHGYLKPLDKVLEFGAVNLLATCVTEEAFMRLMLQLPLLLWMERMTRHRLLQEAIPLVLVTLVFAVTHFSAQGMVLVIFTLAGFCYGLVYSLTKNIGAAIALHFLVNILHFSFLTYPVV